ncbi:MAG: hypothetical protein CBC13_03555 [Planctomycetia bacterium TMED53]|nr:MAG: hypothetical protein CBC13_03555 [Planctomycetia bacterium TMED53]
MTSGNSGTTGQLSSGTARLNEAEVVKTTGVIRNEGTQQGSQRGSSAVTASGSQRTVNKPAKAPLPQRQFKKITVRSGDSLWRIAERHLGSGNAYNKIISANSGLTESTVLKEGQVLRVPVAGGTSQPQRTSRPAVARGAKAYQIQEGDTLWDIASDRLGDGNRWQEIREANPGVNLDVLKVGVVINLP